jgi:hypothetical protein
LARRQIDAEAGLSKVLSFSAAKSLISSFARTTTAALPVGRVVHSQAAAAVGLGVAFEVSGSHSDIYNILWAVVFGFATLNILNLAARRFEPTRRGMSFGELMAVMVVLLSVFLLGWEMLNMFHVFPIRLRR